MAAAAGVSVVAVTLGAVITGVVVTPWLARRAGVDLPGPVQPEVAAPPRIPSAAWPLLAGGGLAVAVLVPVALVGALLGGTVLVDSTMLGLLGGRAAQHVTRALAHVEASPCRRGARLRCRTCPFGETPATPAPRDPPCQRLPMPPHSGGCGEGQDFLRDIDAR